MRTSRARNVHAEGCRPPMAPTSRSTMRRSSRGIVAAAIVLALPLIASHALAQTNQGTDFWLAETSNHLASGANFAIVIANPNGVTANVTIEHFGDPNLLDTVSAGGLKTFEFPQREVCQDGGNNLGKNMVYHVTSDIDVVVYIFNPLQNVFTNDASLVLPVPALGKRARAGSWVDPSGNSRGSFVGVVGATDGTTVQTFDRSGALVDSVVINQGEYFERSTNCSGDSIMNDVTGWEVVTSAPAAVFTGSDCTSIGASGACDHLEEQALPLEAISNTYVACPSLTRPVGCDPATPGSCTQDTFRYVATVANTNITTSPNVGGGLLTNPGDFVTITTSTPHVVTADNPIYGYQYLISQDAGSPAAGTGDPSILDMPPVDQFQFRYIFLTPNTYAYDFINVVAPVGTTITLDGNPLANACNAVGAINNVTYCCFGAPVADGVHEISGDKKFGLSVSGFDQYASYGYIGGLGLEHIQEGCRTGGPYSRDVCVDEPQMVQLNGSPSCSDQSTPTLLWSSNNGATFDDATKEDPIATVPGIGTFNICLSVTCGTETPSQCCSDIEINQQSNCNTTTSTTSTTTTSTTTTSTSTTTLPDHEQCYEVKPASFPPLSVQAQDEFGTLNLSLRFPHRLCAPADKNNEGIQDPTEHLAGYPARGGSFTRRTAQTVQNQFGTLTIDIIRPDLFLVPTAKDGVALTPPVGDHFTCYKVRRSAGAAKFTAHTVHVTDQFETVTETLLKPIWLCAPANKNNEDPTAPSHPGHLLCYKPKGAAFPESTHQISNQFGPDSVKLIHRRELCVPSLLNSTAPTTTTSTVAQPTTTTSTTVVATTTTSTSTTVIGSPSLAFPTPIGSLLE